jgi:hypothetical protein
LEAAPRANNPVLTRSDVKDVCAVFVADPFMLRVRDLWYMFFEVYNHETDKGEIGLAISGDGFTWNYQHIVLAEPFHLSYPYVFEWEGDFYMIPESHKAGDIRLYKASRFPTEWTQTDTLLTGQTFSDSSLFRHDAKWWLFTETNLDHHDTLRLYYATNLSGPWHEHPKSPIIYGDPHIARPAGRVLTLPGSIVRYSQDCYPTYGTEVRAFEITELTTSTYKECQVLQSRVLGPSGIGWNAHGMHHLDPHLMDNGQWIACVDGWVGVDNLWQGLKQPAC